MSKKKIILISTLSSLFIVSLVIILALNTNILSKLKGSIIDPVTGDVCIEDTTASNILHENGQTVKEILDELYAESDSTCATGYACHKPTLPTVVEPESCFTLDSSRINYSRNNNTMSVEDAVKQLYTIYNSAGFCPQKYCKPVTYPVTLDKNGGTTQGTPKVYEKYDTGVYLDENENNEMTGSTNPITKPTKVYTISYNGNSQGASYTGTPTESAATFKGYFTSATGGTKMIDENGYIVESNFPNNKYSAAATLYAQYDDNNITLPAITKADSECKWAEGSASGTQYAGGTSRPISANTTYYAVCVSYPTLTVENYTCNDQGASCTKVKTDTYRKVAGTTETINATSQSGYQTPSSRSVTYGTHTKVKFYHTAPTSVATISTVYTSRQLKAIHTGDHTDIYVSDSRPYMCTEVATYGIEKQIIGYTRYNSSTYSGFPYLFPFADNTYSGASYLNGAKGTYYIRTCSSQDSTDCTDAEELRPYIEIKYDLKGGTGTSSTQTKYAGQSLTLHGTPSKTGYTFKGWKATVSSSEEVCKLCNGSGGACDKDSYYAAGRSLNDQEWNVGNESWPCSSKEAYENNTNTVYLRAVWNRNPWNEVE